MFFLVFSKDKRDLAKRELFWKAYTIIEALPTTKTIQIISPNKFAKVVLDPEQETFVIHIATLFKPIKAHTNWEVQITALIANKALTTILAEYSDFEHMFSKKSIAVLLEYTEINTHAIDLEESK